MKLSRKVIAAISTAAAIVVAGTVAGCKKEDDEDPYNLIAVVGEGATIDATNNNSLSDGEVDAGTDAKVAKSPTFIRGFKTPSTYLGRKSALYKLTINKSSNGVLGWIFDETSEKPAGAAETMYSFYLLGFKATNEHPSIYLSRFNDVTQSGLTGNDTTFGTEFTMIDSGTTNASDATSGSKWYYRLNDVNYDANGDASIYVAVKQTGSDGRFSIGIFAANTTDPTAEQTAKGWYNSNGNPTTGTDAKRLITLLNAANFAANAKEEDQKTFKGKYDGTVTNAVDNFGITTDGTCRKNQFGFYAMIPAKGSLKGSWTHVEWDALEDEVVEE